MRDPGTSPGMTHSYEGYYPVTSGRPAQRLGIRELTSHNPPLNLLRGGDFEIV
jgi:hypothetical protein